MFLTFTRILIFFVVVTFATKNLTAQSMAKATASATIVTDPDLSISEMNVEAMPVTIDHNASIILPANRVTGSYKTIAVYSISNYAYAVTIPSEAVILKRKDGVETISAVLSIQPPCNDIPGENSPTIIIGAVFKTATILPPGHYSSPATYNITVNYN